MALAIPPPIRRYPDLRGVVRMPARQAAVQLSTKAPTSAIAHQYVGTGLTGIMRDNVDPHFAIEHQERLQWAKFYAQYLDVPAFAALIISETCAGCDLIVQRRDGDEWADEDLTKDDQLDEAFNQYENSGTGQGIKLTRRDLVGIHAYHYQVSGDMFSVVTERPGAADAADWSLYDTDAITFVDHVMINGVRVPTNALVKLVPGGTPAEGTAFKVPANQVVRLWRPHPMYHGLSTSPMVAGIGHCHSLWASMRYTRRQTDSALAMQGFVWTPSEAHDEKVRNVEPPYPEDMGPPPGFPPEAKSDEEPMSQLMADFLDVAARSVHDDDSLTSVAPFLIHYPNSLQAPVKVDLAHPLDEGHFRLREESREGIARPMGMPTQLLKSGGVGEQNHWNAWLDQDNFDRSIGSQFMDRICEDMTAIWLEPLLVAIGRQADVGELRVWYDSSPVIVRPDRSEVALQLRNAGILKSEKTLEASNYDEADLMDDAERKQIAEFEAAKRGRAVGDVVPGAPPGSPVIDAPAPGGPAVPGAGRGPQSVAQAPPARALAPGPENPRPRGAAASDSVALPVDATAHAARARTNAARSLLAKIVKAYESLGKALKSSAEQAFRDAVSHGGGKVKVRAHNKRVTPEAKQAAIAAVDAGMALTGGLGPHLAAVGATEADLLRQAFDGYESHAAELMSANAARVRAMIIRAGFDPESYLGDAADVDEAATFLREGLQSLAWQRLSSHHPFEMGPGEVSGNVPGSLVRDALDVFAGAAEAHGPLVADAMPTITTLLPGTEGSGFMGEVLADLKGQLAIPVGWEPEGGARPPHEVVTEWTWVHGFLGDPLQPFDPHDELGADEFTTTDPTNDPGPNGERVNSGSFPDTDLYEPGDHDGCTCAWVPDVRSAID